MTDLGAAFLAVAIVLLAGAVHAAARFKYRARNFATRAAREKADEDRQAAAQLAGEDRRCRVRCANIDADARVKAAKYGAGAIKARPRPEEPAELTPFAMWLADGGSRKSQADQEAVEWAFAYVAGEDSGAEAGDAASPEGAKEILDRIAGSGWYETAREAAKQPRR